MLTNYHKFTVSGQQTCTLLQSIIWDQFLQRKTARSTGRFFYPQEISSWMILSVSSCFLRLHILLITTYFQRTPFCLCLFHPIIFLSPRTFRVQPCKDYFYFIELSRKSLFRRHLFKSSKFPLPMNTLWYIQGNDDRTVEKMDNLELYYSP